MAGEQTAPTGNPQTAAFGRLPVYLEWLALFAAILAVTWLATQSSAAPQLVLLILLYMISLNFSLPAGKGLLSPNLPIVAVSSLLIVGRPVSLALLAGGALLAEVARPLWQPLWHNLPLADRTLTDRAGRVAVHFLALLAGSTVYLATGGTAPLPAGEAGLATFLLPFLWLALTYGSVQTLLTLLFWRLRGQPLADSMRLGLWPLLMVAFLTQPFAIFGAVTFATLGVPGFVIFCLATGAFAVIVWLSWQRQYTRQQQLRQFSALNDISLSLRETLDLTTVLADTYTQVNALIPAGLFFIALQEADGSWHQPILVRDGQKIPPEPGQTYTPDDFTTWVFTRSRTLHVHPENIHFAADHGLQPPTPRPGAWLGVPLITGEQTRGVMVLQRHQGDLPFSDWSQEVLLALAGQISAAIQNARLYSEVVRLYNLTDEALAERVQQLQALLDSTHEGVLMLDTSGRIVLVNPVAAQLLGHPREELLHHPLQPADMAAALGYVPQQMETLLASLQARQPPAGRSHVFETRLARQNGQGERQDTERRFIERSEGPVRAHNQQLLGWLMVLHDVTEDIERAEWRLNATRMIVHDLRNPITTLSSTLNLIENHLQDQPDQQLMALTRSAQRGSNEILDMVDSLMDMTRLEAGQLVVDAEAMHLPPLLQQVTEYMQPLAQQKQITLETDVPPHIPPIWADAEIMRRVLVNLLDNALKFSPAGGRVVVRLHRHPATNGAEPAVRCVIEDNGPGIPEEHKAHIFDRFVRVNVGGAQVRGTGLGLTFCKLAIAAHQGQIWVEDGPDGGSRFMLILPGVPTFR
jgi:PAS domain S-box-containing protein